MIGLRYWRIKRGGGGRGWWLYTPTRATAYFGAGGWIALELRWLREKWHDEYRRRKRVRAAREVSRR